MTGVERTFDGVICFGGEDWWYHNRGHYDMQMMREISRGCPVVYVNSLGMRMPRMGEGRMFVHRVRRKLRSLRRGAVLVRPNFTVYSPFVIPGRRGMAVSRSLLPRQIRRVARAAGIRRPLLWVACPPGAEAVEALDPVGVIYQRTDRYESFHNVDADQIRAYDRSLKQRADVTLFCSRLLYDEERGGCRAALYVDHGVDYDRFAAAGDDPASVPADIGDLPRPRAVFVGGIDAHTFAPSLFAEVVRAMPDVQFALVGACSLPEGWCDAPNITLLGQREYDDVPGYMAAGDVLLMPWNDSPWIKACNPVKLKEYLAVGRPIVSTSFDELEHYDDLVHVADDATSFVDAIRRALGQPGDVARMRERVRAATWSNKARQVLDDLAARGVTASERTGDQRIPVASIAT